jgi:AAA+ ATPase superfamily predicted ATPase
MQTDFRGSEIQDYLRCKKRYNYRWIQKLEPKEANEKLTIGSAIHKFLELWHSEYRIDEAMEATFKYMLDASEGIDHMAYEDMLTLVSKVCRNYTETYNHDPNWTVLATEKQFSIPLDDGTNYIGTIDMIVEDEDGYVWFIDHKTTVAIDIFDKNSDMDRQISRYWWALEQLDYNVHGFIYNIILKDFPQLPKLLKSGQLSKDKSQKTTATMYRKAILINKLNEADYADFLQFLDEQPKEFFRRIKVERTQAEVLASIDEMEDVIEDIRNTKSYYRNITKDCHWDCAFKSLCQAEMDGSNANHIRNELFKVKEVE